MKKRKEISASLRWSVFARDGFCCRYCGGQAGEEGIELAVDHVVSIAEGGDNKVDNLVTACKRCNGGKGAKSLASAPSSAEVIRRTTDRANSLAQVAAAMEAAIQAKREAVQQIVNMKCEAYGTATCRMDKNEEGIALALAREFGADLLMDWYHSAATRLVEQERAVKYICGCARCEREKVTTDG